ncbi:MAG: type II secretion system F family protein [bacterium]|nr:type II secretion system F family protein [bacterium]
MKFNYQARDEKGETQTGVIDASSREAALQLLGRRSLYVTLLDETGDAPWYSKRIALFEHVSGKDVVTFSRQIAIMFKSQVPLVESLHTISQQSTNQAFKEKILKMSEGVEGGTAFSKVLSDYPEVFSPFYVNMVRSGEVSGKLSEVLNKLADHLEREYGLVSKIKGAMVYPIFVVALAVGVLFLMVFFVVPRLTEVLQESGQELPAITKGVIGFTVFIRSWGWLLLLFLIAGGTVFMRWSRTKEGRDAVGRVLLRIPLISPFLKMLFLSRFAENLATLIAGGIPITQSLEISAAIVGNSVYEQIIEESKDSISHGTQISSTLQRHPKEFPPLFTQMLQVGERAGNMEETLLAVARFYQQEVDRTVDSLLSLLEPLLIVTLGLGVGFLMAAVVLPLYQIGGM